MKLKIEKIHPEAKLPTCGHAGDAGMDLYGLEKVTIEPGERVVVGTGIAMAIPNGYVGLIWDKSGLAVKAGVTTLAGVIDATYRGEIKVCLYNLGQEAKIFEVGDKIAQILIQKFETPEIIEGNLDETARGEGGFGSTGNR